MIYLKTELKDGKKLKVDVYGDEFYCLCPGCGKEVHLDDEMVKHCASDGDFGSTSFYCKECTKKKHNIRFLWISTKKYRCFNWSIWESKR